MILLLIAIIIVNCSVVALLWKANRKSKALHLQKTALLESAISELLDNYEAKSQKLQLAEEVRERLRTTKNKLNADILSLQYEFLEALTRNKLVE